MTVTKNPNKPERDSTTIKRKSNLVRYHVYKERYKRTKSVSDKLRYEKKKDFLKSQCEMYRKNNPEKRMFSRTKSRAKYKGLEFNLTVEDIVIPTICPILGIELKAGDYGKFIDSSPSLDRIDSAKGYIKGNVEVISHRANTLKNNGTLQEFQLLVAHLLRK